MIIKLLNEYNIKGIWSISNSIVRNIFRYIGIVCDIR